MLHITNMHRKFNEAMHVDKQTDRQIHTNRQARDNTLLTYRGGIKIVHVVQHS